MMRPEERGSINSPTGPFRGGRGLDRRRLAAAGVGAGLGALLGGASGPRKAAEAQANPDAGEPIAASGGYLRTIADAVGEVTIEAPPERIFTPDPLYPLDALLALGVEPALIGTVDAAWEPLSYQAAAAGVPTLVAGAAGPNIETLVAAGIDLIVIYAPAADYYRSEADLRPAGAPIVALPDMDFAAQLRIAGAALALEAEAEREVAAIERLVSGYRPPRVPASIEAFCSYNDGAFFMYKAESPLSRMLDLFGLPPLSPPPVSWDPGRDPVWAPDISLEAIPELEADLLIGLDFEDGYTDISGVEASPLFGRLPAVREGRYARLGREAATALCYPSVLSLPVARVAIDGMVRR